MNRTQLAARLRLGRTARWLSVAAALSSLALTATTAAQAATTAALAMGSRREEDTMLNVTRRRVLLIAGPLAATVLLTGCGSAQPAATSAARQPIPALSGLHAVSAPAARTYLGTVKGTRAFIGIVLDSGHARAYVCDGTPRRTGTLADWFAGPVRGSLLQAASSQHHARLAARLDSEHATGTITLADGQSMHFTITPVPATGRRAGIFAGTARLHGRTYQAGWIILPDGRQRGAAFYPTGPVKALMIAISNYPSGPV